MSAKLYTHTQMHTHKHTHTHAPTHIHQTHSSLDSVPYLPHREPQSCLFSSHQRHSTKSDRSTHTLTHTHMLTHTHTVLWFSLGDIRLSHALVLQVAAAVPAKRGMSAGVRGETCAKPIYDCKSLQFAPLYGEKKQQLTSEESLTTFIKLCRTKKSCRQRSHLPRV